MKSNPQDELGSNNQMHDNFRDKQARVVGSPTSSLFYNELDFFSNRQYDSNQYEVKNQEFEKLSDTSQEGSKSEPISIVSSIASKRKNSIEMFLSQSPSQSLGNDFIKLNLEEPLSNLEEPLSSRPFRLNSPSKSLLPPYESSLKHIRSLHNSSNVHSSSNSNQFLHEIGNTKMQGPYTKNSSNQNNSINFIPPGFLSIPANDSSTSQMHNDQSLNWDHQHLRSNTSDTYTADNHLNNSIQHPLIKSSMNLNYTSTVPLPHGKLEKVSPYSSNISINSMSTQSNDGKLNTATWKPFRPHSDAIAQGSSSTIYAVTSKPPTSMDHTMYQQSQHLSSYRTTTLMHHGKQNASSASNINATKRSLYVNPYSNQILIPTSSPSLIPIYGAESRSLIPPLPESSASLNYKYCKFYSQGHCRMGNKCKFVHENNANITPPSSSAGSFEVSGGNNYSKSNMLLYKGNMYGNMSALNEQKHLYKQSQHNAMGSLTQSPQQLNPIIADSNTAQGSNSGIEDSSMLTVVTCDDIQGRVFAMSKDQNGCRLLQEQFDFVDRFDICELIYKESLVHLPEMMIDPFGNYLFQKLLQHGSIQQRYVMLSKVSQSLVSSALNLHGTRSVQKIIEIISESFASASNNSSMSSKTSVNYSVNFMNPTYNSKNNSIMPSRNSSYGETNSSEENSFNLNYKIANLVITSLQKDIVRLCIDSNGNHVIQRALQCMPSDTNQFIFDAVSKECLIVGTHRHGCCVLQRCLDAASKLQKYKLICDIERNAMQLMQDPYGNYVIQYVIETCSAEECMGVICNPLHSIYELSIQKFSSNVIEKCMEKAPMEIVALYVKEIIQSNQLHEMLQDQFANYVIQRAISVSSEDICLELVHAIKPYLTTMKNTSSGRRIQARILKKLPLMEKEMGDCLY